MFSDPVHKNNNKHLSLFCILHPMVNFIVSKYTDCIEVHVIQCNNSYLMHYYSLFLKDILNVAKYVCLSKTMSRRRK